MTTPDTRVQRLCDVCFQVDDHPRHVRFVLDGGVPSQAELARIPDGTSATAIAEVLDPTSVVRHFDCCAANGCPTCPEQLKLAGRARGNKLLAAIQSNAEEHQAVVEKKIGNYELNREPLGANEPVTETGA